VRSRAAGAAPWLAQRLRLASDFPGHPGGNAIPPPSESAERRVAGGGASEYIPFPLATGAGGATLARLKDRHPRPLRPTPEGAGVSCLFMPTGPPPREAPSGHSTSKNGRLALARRAHIGQQAPARYRQRFQHAPRTLGRRQPDSKVPPIAMETLFVVSVSVTFVYETLAS
jgi:hypothetical protein